jgi:dipeptidyl aminopeptidase/acylaminoacyl peptidase
MIVHPTEKTIQAVTFNYDRRKWKIIDESIDSDLEYLHSIADGAEIQIASRTLDDRLWTVTAERDNGAEQYFLYDRDAHRATKLFSSNEPLDRLPLVNMHTAVIRSRDGWPLVSYLSLPAGTDRNGDGRPETPLPMVLSVHGGPWARDAWGYNPLHQLLANRGYAVLSVNYRGSTGFGKQFTNAANGEWAGKMHEDLLDAVRWATAEKIADRQRIAIMGGSFGGYATLVGMTFSPDIFACGIDISGPSNLATLLENPPPYWMPLMPVLRQRVGDHRTEQGQADLASRSPLRFADRIKRPMLIAQGAEDPRVRRAETDQIVDAMRRQQIPVTYLLYPNEGHGLQKQSNRFAFYAAAEAFLAEHLGGRYQPPGNVYRDADIQVLAGREYIRGMQ